MGIQVIGQILLILTPAMESRMRFLMALLEKKCVSDLFGRERAWEAFSRRASGPAINALVPVIFSSPFFY